MTTTDTCPDCHGPLTDVSKDGFGHAHTPRGNICLTRQLAAEREAHARTKAALITALATATAAAAAQEKGQ